MDSILPSTPARRRDLIWLLPSGRLVANGAENLDDATLLGGADPLDFRPRACASNYLTLAGEVTFSRNVSARLLVLAGVQCRAARAAFQARKAAGGKFNPSALRNKFTNWAGLNSQYANSAIALYQNVDSNSSPLFGGKKAWLEMADGKMTKRAWQHQRNSTIYSQGAKHKRGNPQIRLGLDSESKIGSINVRLPGTRKGTRGEEVLGKARLYRKDIPVAAWQAMYTVKLVHESGTRWALYVSFPLAKDARPTPTLDTEKGVLGVDINPQHLAIVRLNKVGNQIATHRIVRPGMIVASVGKRKHWALEMAKELVGMAKADGVPLVVEALDFGRHVKRPKGMPRNRKANRIRHNFCYAHILRAIFQEAARQGVVVIHVNPAYSSVLGRKYAHMYQWEIHLGAALVIGRRGLGLSERQTFQFTATTPKPRWQQRVTGKRSTSTAKPAGSGSNPGNTGRGSSTVNSNHRLVELTEGSLLRLAAEGFVRIPGRRQRLGLSPRSQEVCKAAPRGGRYVPKPKAKAPSAVTDDTANKAVTVHSRAALPPVHEVEAQPAGLTDYLAL